MGNKKINIAEILRACPKGMELKCDYYDGVIRFEEIYDNQTYPIRISITFNGKKYYQTLTDYGSPGYSPFSKCIIFPKNNISWEGFIPPCKFKDGDIVSFSIFPECTWIGIFKQYEENGKTFETYCSLNAIGEFNGLCLKRHSLEGTHLATEEDKQELFDSIKANGYKWNAEKKCLEKLKADKFDINTLVTFEDKVLVRDDKTDKWIPATWGFYDDSLEFSYTIEGGNEFNMCIPYKGNEHLLGTTDDCDDYFKTWEE